MEGMDPTLGHLADHEIPDGHVVDVFVVRPERGLRVIGRRPAGAVEDRPYSPTKALPVFGLIELVN